MKQNKIMSLIAGVLFVIAITGCQTTPTPVAATQTAVPTTASYPSPMPLVTPTPESYLAPATLVVPTQGSYPSPVSGSSPTAWTDAEQMIIKGDVTQILQTKSLDVTLTLRDGQTVTTTAPAADAVQQAITTCGDLCKDIILTIQ